MTTSESGAGEEKPDAAGTAHTTEQATPAESAAIPTPVAAPRTADEWWTPPRPPRQRWIAPARRKTVTLIATAAGLALFGLGIIVGAFVGDHRDHRHMPMFRQDGFSQFQRGPYGGPRFGPDQGFGDQGFGNQNDRRFPMGPGQMGPNGQFPGPNPSASTTPKPSTSS